MAGNLPPKTIRHHTAADSEEYCMTASTVTIEVTLTLGEAYALAELTKRIGFNDARDLAVDKDEAYRMIWATTRVRDGLEKQGVAVR